MWGGVRSFAQEVAVSVRRDSNARLRIARGKGKARANLAYSISLSSGMNMAIISISSLNQGDTAITAVLGTVVLRKNRPIACPFSAMVKRFSMSSMKKDF